MRRDRAVGRVTALLYTRLSVADPASMSHESQEAACRAYCLARGLEVVDRVSDDGVSGGTPFDEREGGRRVLEAANGAAVEHVVVAKLDRFARSAIDALTWLDKLAANGVALHCLDLGLDTSTPVGRLVYTVLAAVAELERERIRERTSEALQTRKRLGKAWGTTPFGYRKARDKTLIPVSEELAALEAACAARAAGATWEAVREYLLPFKGAKGGKWSMRTVVRVVTRAMRERGAA